MVSKIWYLEFFSLTWIANRDRVCLLKCKLFHSHYQAAVWEEKQTMLWASTIHALQPFNLLCTLEMWWLCLCHTFNRACFPEIRAQRKRIWAFWVPNSCPTHNNWFLSYFRICLNLQTWMEGLNVSRVYLYNLGLRYPWDKVSLPHLSTAAARQVCFVFPPGKTRM